MAGHSFLRWAKVVHFLLGDDEYSLVIENGGEPVPLNEAVNGEWVEAKAHRRRLDR